MKSIDARIDAALRMPEVEVADAGFSETVIGSLPRRRISHAVVRRWTLGGGAAAGSFVTSLVGAPLEEALSAFVLNSGSEIPVIVVMLVGCALLVPVAWLFYSK